MTTPRKRTPRTRKPVSPKVAPPPVQSPDPEYDLADYHDYEPGLMPVPQSSAFKTLLLMAMASMLSITVFLLIDRRSPAPPEPTPVVVPANNLSAFTAPIKAKLATDRAKAATVADAYLGLSAAIAGKTGERLTSSRIFETAHGVFLTDVDAMGGVAVGTEIDQAIGGYLGMTKETGGDSGWEPITFEPSHRVKLAEITAAIAEAAREAK